MAGSFEKQSPHLFFTLDTLERLTSIESLSLFFHPLPVKCARILLFNELHIDK
jgi:hypothetical protein